jgi:hypothetical protein
VPPACPDLDGDVVPVENLIFCHRFLIRNP